MTPSQKRLLIGFTALLALGGATRSNPPVPLKTTKCEGCHAMVPQHASWRMGNHAKAAACGDCHLPPGALAHRSQAMAADGLRHAAMTALGATPSVIRLRGAGAEVVQANCVRCHPPIPPGADPEKLAPKPPRPLRQPTTSAHADLSRGCMECHRETAHARRIVE